MNVTAEDLRRHYDSLSDAALLAIQKSDLTDLARACYEEECERRGFGGPAAGAQTSAASAEGVTVEPVVIQLVTVADSLAAEEARYARELLASAGIPSEIANPNPTAAFSNAVGDYTLQVSEEFAEHAREILGAELTEEELAAQAEAAGLEDGADEETP
jgi:hypothetical protein